MLEAEVKVEPRTVVAVPSVSLDPGMTCGVPVGLLLALGMLCWTEPPVPGIL